MLFLTRNRDLVINREKTYLTGDADAADTTLTVRAVDSNAWADNDYIIVGEIGSENAEIMQLNGAVTDGPSVTIDRSGGAGGLRNDHSVGEPVYRVAYNRIEFSRNTTDTSAGVSVLATQEIQPDDLFTRYEDASNTTGFGFVRFNNELSGTFSAYSDGIPYTGYHALSLGKMLRLVRKHLGLENDFVTISDEDIIDELNEKQRDVAHIRLWPFYENIFSDSTVAYQREYTIDDDVVIGKPHTVVVRSEPQAKIDSHRFDNLYWDTATTGDPTHCSVWNNQLRFYPTPSDAADTDALNGALTATATTITVDSTSGFAPSGRIIIDSEVISYTNLSSTAFRGCTRGLEGTTAATHSDDATVTERDIIYTANEEPTDLLDPNDRTQIPNALVLVYGADMELAIAKLNDQVLHDRYQGKYFNAVKRLKSNFGQKYTQGSYRIKDKTEVVTDLGRFKNPNNPPTEITSA